MADSTRCLLSPARLPAKLLFIRRRPQPVAHVHLAHLARGGVRKVLHHLDQKWLRLFEQYFPIYKWIPGRLRRVQSCPRGRASLATNAAVPVLVILLFMPRGLVPWVRGKIETACPRCKARNGAWRGECRLCGADLRGVLGVAGRTR